MEVGFNDSLETLLKHLEDSLQHAQSICLFAVLGNRANVVWAKGGGLRVMSTPD